MTVGTILAWGSSLNSRRASQWGRRKPGRFLYSIEVQQQFQCPFMIDIHSHVLPGLDDGARDIGESLSMLRLAAASGTTDIVATPHANVEYSFDDQRVTGLFNAVSVLIGDTIRMHFGCDFHLDYRNLRDALENPAKYTINHARYLMVELPDLLAFQTVRQGLSQLIKNGIIPVITHPERNGYFKERTEELQPLVKDGCLLQLTAQSLLGAFGKTAGTVAHQLLDKNLVHFVASDAHDCVRRPPNLAAARDYVTARYGAASAECFFVANPAAALSGKALPNSEKPWKRSRFFFMRRS
jgi:protein-tyrosine phosphatase